MREILKNIANRNDSIGTATAYYGIALISESYMVQFFLNKRQDDFIACSIRQRVMVIAPASRSTKYVSNLAKQDCPTRGPRATFGQRSCFAWPARSFCEVEFLMEGLIILLQIKTGTV